MEKTDAASVEPTTEPTKRPSSNVVPKTKWQKSPVSTAVTTTPTVDSRMDGTATGLAIFQLVPRPP